MNEDSEVFSMPSERRLFLGFSVPESVRELLQALQSRLGRHGRAVPRANLHLTLVFLGHTDTRQLSALVLALNTVDKPSFCLTLDHLVHWPGAGVVCLKGEAKDPGLIQLHQECRQMATDLDLHLSEQGFHPHITLLRKVRHFSQPDWAPQSISLRPRALHLYWSRSTPSGVSYDIINSWPLDGPCRIRPDFCTSDGTPG